MADEKTTHPCRIRGKGCAKRIDNRYPSNVCTPCSLIPVQQVRKEIEQRKEQQKKLATKTHARVARQLNRERARERREEQRAAERREKGAT